MVRSNNSRGTAAHSSNGEVVLLDASGQPKELGISPASAFKRPKVGNSSFDSGLKKFCPPPFRKQGLEPYCESTIRLHEYIKASDWKQLVKKMVELKQRDDVFDFHCSLHEQNEDRETPLHAAAWKSPTHVTLRMLELIPANQRKGLLLRRDTAGNTVLHLCCANLDERVEFTVIKNVLLLAPEALDMVNLYGDTPLHLLVCSRGFVRSHNNFTVEIAAEEAVTSLLSLVKEQGLVQNNMGLTLLHCAIAIGAHERVLVQLLKIAPDAATIPDKRGMLPLHYTAAFGGTPYTFVSQLIDVYPAGLLAPTEDGDTPLHLLVVNIEKQLNSDGLLDRNTSKVAELLLSTLNGQKSALFMPNKENLCPLHVCAIFDSPPQLTRILMASEHASEASVIPAHSGWTALHLACAADSSLSDNTENAEVLATHKACRAMDEKGLTPLMLAVKSEPVSTRLVKFLAYVSPKSVVMSTKKGKHLALHFAIARNLKESVIRTLVKANPASLKMQDSNGDTALHIACKRGMSVNVVKYLLSKCKDVRRVMNKKGEYPVDLAEWHGLAADVPELHDQKILPEKDRFLDSLSSEEIMRDQKEFELWFA